MNRRAVGLLVPLLALALASCQHWPFGSRALRKCPGDIASTESLAGDFLLRQSVRVERGDSAWSLQLVSQLHEGELRLIGLDPLGVELFTLRQRGRELEVTALPPPMLEIPPENLLRDLHRIRFRRVGAPGSNGTLHAIRGDVEIVETWDAGRLVRRDFRSAERDRLRRAEVVFSQTGEAQRASIENFSCGYRAEFTTLESRRLQ
jgi:hypothetical protein